MELSHPNTKAGSVPTLLLFLAALLPAQPYQKIFFQKGVNFTAEHPSNYNPIAGDGALLSSLRW